MLQRDVFFGIMCIIKIFREKIGQFLTKSSDVNGMAYFKCTGFLPFKLWPAY